MNDDFIGLKTPNSMFKEMFRLEDEAAYMWNGLSVIRSVEEHDGVMWIHVSCARKSRLPSYDELQLVRREFIGEDKESIMIFPKKENYVNIHHYCLHLFSTDKMPLSEMSGFVGGIKSI